MNERIHDLMNYLDSAHSVFHAVEGLKNILEEKGYIRLQESGKWDLQPGGKYFMTRGGASIMAFRFMWMATLGMSSRSRSMLTSLVSIPLSVSTSTRPAMERGLSNQVPISIPP